MAAEIRPQPGPQENFLKSPADIVIYGGGAGGGKTWALLMECVRHSANKHFGAVIFRRQSVQITNEGGLWDNAMAMYPLIGARPVKSPTLCFVFSSGAKITFAHLNQEEDVTGWQGAQVPLLCCEVGTKVRMADGSLMEIERLSVGNMVDTLQGPRQITAVGAVRQEPCVRVVMPDGKEQVHSISHAVLTENGWVSFDETYKFGESLPVCSCGSMQYSRDSEYGLCSQQKSQEIQPPHDSLPYHQQLTFAEQQQNQDHQASPGFSADVVALGQETDYGLFECDSQEILPPPLVRPWKERLLQVVASLAGNVSRAQLRYECADALTETELVDWPSCCLTGFGQCGEPARQPTDTYQDGAQLIAGAVLQNRKGLLSDGLDTAQTHNFHKLRYAHPYTGKEQIAEGFCWSCCDLLVTPIGKRDVVDITVEDANHYITETGLVNKNCFDELTHFERSQFFYLLSRNRSMCGVRPYIRATCNPDADSWVAEFIDWWIDADGFPIPSRAGQLRWFCRVADQIQWAGSPDELVAAHGVAPEDAKSVTFIPALVTDNPALMKADPGYLANLKALARVERERLLMGNWRIKPAAGLYFPRHCVSILSAPPTDITAICRAWDLAATPPTEASPSPDATAGVQIARTRAGRFVVMNAITLRGGAYQVREAITNTASQDGHKVRIAIPQDPGQAGKDQASSYVSLLAGYNITTRRPSRDKITRASPFAAQWQAGNVDVVTGPWNESFLSELESFPDPSSHDDQVDAAADAFAEVAQHPGPVTMASAGSRQAATYTHGYR